MSKVQWDTTKVNIEDSDYENKLIFIILKKEYPNNPEVWDKFYKEQIVQEIRNKSIPIRLEAKQKGYANTGRELLEISFVAKKVLKRYSSIIDRAKRDKEYEAFIIKKCVTIDEVFLDYPCDLGDNIYQHVWIPRLDSSEHSRKGIFNLESSFLYLPDPEYAIMEEFSLLLLEMIAYERITEDPYNNNCFIDFLKLYGDRLRLIANDTVDLLGEPKLIEWLEFQNDSVRKSIRYKGVKYDYSGFIHKVVNKDLDDLIENHLRNYDFYKVWTNFPSYYSPILSGCRTRFVKGLASS